MKKSQFKEKYSISDIQPFGIARHPISAVDIADVTKRFIEDNFTGICEISHNVSQNSVIVTVAEEHLICFFRDLLSCVYGKDMITVRMELDSENFNILIEADGQLPIDGEDANGLLRRASRAGFEASINNTCLKLITKYRRFTYYKVYAISADQLYGVYSQLFFGPRVFK